MIRDLIISDLHVGSYYGLMPPKVVFKDEFSGQKMTVLANESQKAMWKYFNDCLEEIGEVDNLIVNGDICDGFQVASKGKYTWTNDLAVQADIAAEIINGIAAERVYCIRGSDYHCQADRPLEQDVANKIDNGRYREETVIEHKDYRYHVSHFVPVSSSAFYRSTPIAKAMLVAALNQKEEEYGPLNAVVRSHAHFWCAVSLGHSWGFVTPGWQNRTPFALKIGTMSTPDIGCLLLEIDEKKGKLINIREMHRHFGPQCPVDRPEVDG